MKKKTLCLILAIIVSLCAAVSLFSTIRLVLSATEYGSPIPSGMILLSLVTIFCAIMIWSGMRHIKD